MAAVASFSPDGIEPNEGIFLLSDFVNEGGCDDKTDDASFPPSLLGSVDLTGPPVADLTGNSAAIAIVASFSSWVWLVPCREDDNGSLPLCRDEDNGSLSPP